MAKKREPERTDARRWGAWALALLLVLALPGIALALRYAPDPLWAHAAVARMDAGLLRGARGAHWWAATLVLAAAVLHAARAYVNGRMGVPGRGGALAGLAALALLVGAFFTGTILPWDQQGWEAYQHLAGGAALVGVAMPGSPAAAPLGALFWLHVLGAPVALAALLLVHLRRGALGADARRVGRLLRESWRPIAVTVGAVLVLGRLAPPFLGPEPLEGLVVSRPDWPFLWLVPVQDALGTFGLLALPLAFVLAGVLVWRPLPGSRAGRRAVVALVALGWGALTLAGAW